jgi:hypothetical protein
MRSERRIYDEMSEKNSRNRREENGFTREIVKALNKLRGMRVGF